MKHITLLALLLFTSLASAQIISQYVETDSGTSPKGLEIWNNTDASIDFSVDNLFIEKGTNGGDPSLDFTIDSGVLQSGEVLVVGTIDMEPTAIANGVLFYEKNFTFNGDDALVIKLGTTTTDVFGEPGSDPGTDWEGNGVSTRNSNIALLSDINTGELVGFTDPSTRFETINTTPSDIENGGLEGFGIAPNAVNITLDNSGASAYFVSNQSTNITDLNTNNSDWNLEVGKRYEIDVVNPGPHPLMIRDASNTLLLGMSAANGSFATDAEVDFVTDASTGQFDFTLTEALAQEINNYACEIHTASMNGLINVTTSSNFDLQITEIFSGQAGDDLTEDWFEIKNNGTEAWVSGTDPDLYYDDESADATTADLIQGITDIQPGESVIVIITDNTEDITTFQNVWGEILDISNLEVGYTDGSGLGGGGDAVSLWLGDPLASEPFEIASYPDTDANDGQSYDVDLGEFSVVGNANGAVATLQLGGNAADVPNIGSPGDALPLPADLVITEIFSGQSGDDLTEDWFEIKNNGGTAWVSGTDPDLYYDDESADETTADLIQGITDIQPGESVVVLITDNTTDIITFQNVWGEVLDLSNVEVGYVDGAGLGGGGDAVNLWLGNPLDSTPFETASYPDTDANDGQSYDVDLGEFSVVGNPNGAVATLQLGGNASDVPNIGSPGDAPQSTEVQLSFDESILSIDENGDSVTIEVSPSIAPANSPSVEVTIMSGGTAVEGTHFTFSTTTLNFTSGSTDAQTLTIPIIDNDTDDSSVFFVLELSNPTDATLGNSVLPVYILDDDNDVPVTDDTVLDMNYLTSYTVDADGTAEISKFDPNTQRLYVVNNTKIEIIDLSDPTAPSTIGNIDVTPFGSGAQSVDIKDGLVAIAVAANVTTDLGSVVFTDIDGNNAVQITAGALPDMLTFTPDGNSVLVANEGEPSQDYTIDPEGSITVIDVTGGLAGISQANVTEINFNSFDDQLATLVANDVRIFGPGASVSQDLEPEFITVSEDSQTAYVACQENNAYAIVDLTTNTVTDIVSFGLKDHSLPENTLDVSNDTDFIFDASWPIKGMYMPDGITNYNVGGINYLVTANEGDAREYSAYEEERNISDSDYILDPAVFQDIDILALEANLGAINVTNASGDANGDGLFEEIHVYGGRSFSIFNADTGDLVYDSGNDFAHITAADPVYGAIFNASNSNNSFKNRSDNKGVEPENVIVQEINGNNYAFIILERIGGVMAYDVTDPSAPVFLEYENSRDATPGGEESGDLGPEGIVYIAPEHSGTGKALLVLANEVSATLSIYELSNITLSNTQFELNEVSFKVYPNPVDSILKTEQLGDYSVFNLNGQKLIEVKNTSEINVQNLSKGVYIIKNEKGNSLKFIKR